jgi:response regulator RpfG family c-di-GMP phosphodiesterase
MPENPSLGNRIAIETQPPQVFEELKVNPLDRIAIDNLLEPLKQKDIKTHEHSIGVGLLARKIGKFMHMDERSLFFAGLLHDLGKTEVPVEILKKTEGWTKEDMEAIKQHVVYGYDKIKGRFDFTAEIILLHHIFQENGYPGNLPPFLHNYSAQTQTLIIESAKVLSLADIYDALHRENDKFGEKRKLSDTEIKNKMFELKFCKKETIEDLYKAGVFL